MTSNLTLVPDIFGPLAARLIGKDWGSKYVQRRPPTLPGTGKDAMYYRMTRLHFSEEALDGLISWMNAQEKRLVDIDGLLTWDIAQGGATEGMIIASYRDKDAYQAAEREVTSILEEMAPHLTDRTHGHDGTVVYTLDL